MSLVREKVVHVFTEKFLTILQLFGLKHKWERKYGIVKYKIWGENSAKIGHRRFSGQFQFRVTSVKGLS